MKKNYIKLIIAIEAIGILMQGLSFYDTYGMSLSEVERPAEIGGKEEKSLFLEKDDGGEEIDLSVLAENPTDEEIEGLFAQAIDEIEGSFLGENKDYENVWKQVSIRDTYAGEKVEASWEFTPRGIVDASGNIDMKAFSESEIITGVCTLSAFEKEKLYNVNFVVTQPDENTADGFMYYIKAALDEENEKREGEMLILPGSVKGQKLTWRKPMSYSGLLLCMLGLLAGVSLYAGSYLDEKKDSEKLLEQYGREYPDIVENLGLYVGAGISVKGAFLNMERQYMNWKKKHPKEKKLSYEKIILMNRAIKDGKLEGDAYESFGKACMHPSYRKLSILLKQNLKRGNDKLLEQLAHEEQLVGDARRREIKSAGEMISTKLLLPMGGLLLMILIVLIVPALQSIQL